MLLALWVAPAANAALLFDVGPADVAETVRMTRLPAWVQVAIPTAKLWAADTSSGTPMGTLPRWTYLKVTAGGARRLQVQAYDEAAQPVQRGWIDADDVLPSASATDWLFTANPTSLYRTADQADQTLTLDRFTPLQQIDGPRQGRVAVRVYASNFSVKAQGWVDAADLGPALAPQTRVASPTDEPPARKTQTVSQQTFLETTSHAAQVAAAQTGVPASVTVAQAILESDWGRSQLARVANNYFGVKAIGSLGSDGVIYLPTTEYDDSGQLYRTESAFRAYKSLTDSLADHDNLLKSSSRYMNAMQAADDPREFAARLYQAGYSTDPDYADKLVALMDRYDLYRLDT